MTTETKPRTTPEEIANHYWRPGSEIHAAGLAAVREAYALGAASRAAPEAPADLVKLLSDAREAVVTYGCQHETVCADAACREAGHEHETSEDGWGCAEGCPCIPACKGHEPNTCERATSKREVAVRLDEKIAALSSRRAAPEEGRAREEGEVGWIVRPTGSSAPLRVYAVHATEGLALEARGHVLDELGPNSDVSVERIRITVERDPMPAPRLCSTCVLDKEPDDHPTCAECIASGADSRWLRSPPEPRPEPSPTDRDRDLGLYQKYEVDSGRAEENPSDRYDRLAAEFHRETGMMAPGKDVRWPSTGGGTYEERAAAWEAWLTKRRAPASGEESGR